MEGGGCRTSTIADPEGPILDVETSRALHLRRGRGKKKNSKMATIVHF